MLFFFFLRFRTIISFLVLLLLFSCFDKKILYTDRLSLGSIAIDGKLVPFDREKDFYVYPVDKNATSVRLRITVIENDGDVFFTIQKKGNITVANGSQTTLDPNDKITPFFIRIQNIDGDHVDKVIYISNGELPSLFIKDNLFLETAVQSLALNGDKTISIQDKDYPGMTFSGNPGDDLFLQGKAKIVERAVISSEDYDTFTTLRSYQTTPTNVSLKIISSKEVQFHLDGHYSGNIGKETGYIDIEFDPSAFSIPAGLPSELSKRILYENTYFFRYQFGSAVLSVVNPIFRVNSDRTTSDRASFILQGAFFQKAGSFAAADSTIEVIGLPYDYEASVVINPDLLSGHIEIHRKNLFLTKGEYSFIIKFQSDFFRDISDQDEIAGFAQRFYLQVP